MHRRGISPFSVVTSLSNSTGKLRRVTLLFFIKVPVSETFLHRRVKSRFSVGKSLSHCGEKVVEEPFCFPEELCYRKILSIWAEGITKFQSVSIENFRRGSFLCFRNFLVSKKNYAHEGDITFFCRRYFVSYYRKTSKRDPSVWRKNFGTKKVIA